MANFHLIPSSMHHQFRSQPQQKSTVVSEPFPASRTALDVQESSRSEHSSTGPNEQDRPHASSESQLRETEMGASSHPPAGQIPFGDVYSDMEDDNPLACSTSHRSASPSVILDSSQEGCRPSAQESTPADETVYTLAESPVPESEGRVLDAHLHSLAMSGKQRVSAAIPSPQNLETQVGNQIRSPSQSESVAQAIVKGKSIRGSGLGSLAASRC